MSDRVERRRTPRVTLGPGPEVRLDLRQRSQLVDISRSGVLVTCETGLPVGTRGVFRTALAGLPFSADLAVKRHQTRPGAPGLCHGAAFSSMDERSMRHLEMFLQRGKNGV